MQSVVAEVLCLAVSRGNALMGVFVGVVTKRIQWNLDPGYPIDITVYTNLHLLPFVEIKLFCYVLCIVFCEHFVCKSEVMSWCNGRKFIKHTNSD